MIVTYELNRATRELVMVGSERLQSAIALAVVYRNSPDCSQRECGYVPKVSQKIVKGHFKKNPLS